MAKQTIERFWKERPNQDKLYCSYMRAQHALLRKLFTQPAWNACSFPSTGVQLIALWSKPACDKQGWGSWDLVRSKDSTCEIVEKSHWTPHTISMNQQLSKSLPPLYLPQFCWFCQLSFRYFCLALLLETAILIRYFVLLNCALKSMSAPLDNFFFWFLCIVKQYLQSGEKKWSLYMLSPLHICRTGILPFFLLVQISTHI